MLLNSNPVVLVNRICLASPSSAIVTTTGGGDERFSPRLSSGIASTTAAAREYGWIFKTFSASACKRLVLSSRAGRYSVIPFLWSVGLPCSAKGCRFLRPASPSATAGMGDYRHHQGRNVQPGRIFHTERISNYRVAAARAGISGRRRPEGLLYSAPAANLAALFFCYCTCRGALDCRSKSTGGMGVRSRVSAVLRQLDDGLARPAGGQHHRSFMECFVRRAILFALAPGSALDFPNNHRPGCDWITGRRCRCSFHSIARTSRA